MIYVIDEKWEESCLSDETRDEPAPNVFTTGGGNSLHEKSAKSLKEKNYSLK